MSDDEDWFAPKRFGYGPGVPISWQGWLLTIAFVVILVALCLLLKGRPIQLAASLVPPVTVFVVISCRRTRGGCRWRSGEEE